MIAPCGFCANVEEPLFQYCYCTVVETPNANLRIIIPSTLPQYPYHQRIQTRRSGGVQRFINGQPRRVLSIRILNHNEQPRGRDEIQRQKHINKTMEIFNHNISECPICYDEKNSTTDPMVKTNCNHLFCKDCFDKVVEMCFSNMVSCPMCRTIVAGVIENVV